MKQTACSSRETVKGQIGGAAKRENLQWTTVASHSALHFLSRSCQFSVGCETAQVRVTRPGESGILGLLNYPAFGGVRL